MPATFVSLHVDVTQLGGADVVGTVTVEVPEPLRDSGDHVIYPRHRFDPVDLVAGEVTITDLPATDDADVTSAGYVVVTLELSSTTPAWSETRRIALPSADAVTEYADASSVDPGPASASYATSAQLAAHAALTTTAHGGLVAQTAGVALAGAKNGLAAIQLAGYKATSGAPATGAWATGDVVLDAAGAWHLCTAGGTPGTWT